jgi:hypothetical protein
VTGLSAGLSVFQILAGAGDFSLKCPHGLWGTPIFQSKGNRRTLSLELKLPRCEVHHPHPCGVQIKEKCSCSSAFSIWPHGVYRNNFAFFFTFFLSFLSVYLKFLFLRFPFAYWFLPYFCFVLSLSFIFSILSTAHWITGLPAYRNSNYVALVHYSNLQMVLVDLTLHLKYFSITSPRLSNSHVQTHVLTLKLCGPVNMAVSCVWHSKPKMPPVFSFSCPSPCP